MAGITVAVLTDAGGAHLGSYLAALDEIVEVEAIVVFDPSGTTEAAA